VSNIGIDSQSGGEGICVATGARHGDKEAEARAMLQGADVSSRQWWDLRHVVRNAPIRVDRNIPTYIRL